MDSPGDDLKPHQLARIVPSTPNPKLRTPNSYRHMPQRTLFILSLAVFVTIMGNSMIIPFLPLYVQQFGVSEFGAGLLFSGQQEKANEQIDNSLLSTL